jgi:hypothetical protein
VIPTKPRRLNCEMAISPVERFAEVKNLKGDAITGRPLSLEPDKGRAIRETPISCGWNPNRARSITLTRQFCAGRFAPVVLP